MKNRAAVFPEDDFFLPKATNPPSQNAGGFIRGIGAIPLVPVVSAAGANIWKPVLFYQLCIDWFSWLLTGSSDCALGRKAELPPSCFALGPSEIPPLSDWYDCVCCGERSRTWRIATVANRECVCSYCWPEFSRVRYPRAQKSKVSLAVANDRDAGGSRCTAATPRRYFLKSVRGSPKG